MYLKPIDDENLKNKLKDVVRDCIIKEYNGDFNDEFIEKSGFDFCPIESEFFGGSDDIIYDENFIKY